MANLLTSRWNLVACLLAVTGFTMAFAEIANAAADKAATSTALVAQPYDGACGGGDSFEAFIAGLRQKGVLDNVLRMRSIDPSVDGNGIRILRQTMVRVEVVVGDGSVANTTCSDGRFVPLTKPTSQGTGTFVWVFRDWLGKDGWVHQWFAANCGNYRVGYIKVRVPPPPVVVKPRGKGAAACINGNVTIRVNGSPGSIVNVCTGKTTNTTKCNGNNRGTGNGNCTGVRPKKPPPPKKPVPPVTPPADKGVVCFIKQTIVEHVLDGRKTGETDVTGRNDVVFGVSLGGFRFGLPNDGRVYCIGDLVLNSQYDLVEYDARGWTPDRSSFVVTATRDGKQSDGHAVRIVNRIKEVKTTPPVTPPPPVIPPPVVPPPPPTTCEQRGDCPKPPPPPPPPPAPKTEVPATGGGGPGLPSSSNPQQPGTPDTTQSASGPVNPDGSQQGPGGPGTVILPPRPR